MTQLDERQLCSDIAETFREVANLNRVQDVDEITDTIPEGDMPLLMVYPATTEGDAFGGTQMSSFGGGINRPVQVETCVIDVDIYIGRITGMPFQEAMDLLFQVWAAVKTIVRNQTVKPYFNNAQIQSFQWSMERGTLSFSGADYYGFTLQLSFTEF